MIYCSKRACGVLYHFIRSHTEGCFLLPANVCPVVPLTILRAGSKVEFVDISPETLCIDEQKCLEKIGANLGKYAGVVFVQTYGSNYDTTSFYATLKCLDSRILFIEDRCLCFPLYNELSDLLSDLCLFSTGYAKCIDIGYGGWGITMQELNVVSSNMDFFEVDYEILESKYKQAFKENRLIEDVSGLKWLDVSLLDNASEYFSCISEQERLVRKHKNEINNIYKYLLPEKIQFPSNFQNWRFNIRVDNPVSVEKEIFSHGFFASRHYQPSAYLFNKSIRYPVADSLYSSIINLFNDNHITCSQAERLCKIINDTL